MVLPLLRDLAGTYPQRLYLPLRLALPLITRPAAAGAAGEGTPAGGGLGRQAHTHALFHSLRCPLLKELVAALGALTPPLLR